MMTTLFLLDEKLLEQYPVFSSFSGVSEKDVSIETLLLSAIYLNGGTIDAYLEDVKVGRSTGNVEYHLQIVEDNLRKLSLSPNPVFGDFIRGEREKLVRRTAHAKEVIGDMKRDPMIDGRYRKP